MNLTADGVLTAHIIGRYVVGRYVILNEINVIYFTVSACFAYEQEVAVSRAGIFLAGICVVKVCACKANDRIKLSLAYE
jgi:hypothetical protein